MLTEEISIAIDSINTATKTISIAKDVVIKRDGNQIAKNRNRRGFVPGEIEAVKEYIGMTEGPEIEYLNSIWTSEVISAYQSVQNVLA